MDATKTLESLDLTLDDLVAAGFELYVGEAKGSELQRLKEEYKALLSKNLKEPNVALLIKAASYLDELLKKEEGRVFGSSKDPEALVADELIGMSIAEFIAGKRGLFNYVRYDKAKPGKISRLPPFMDDAVGALVASTMTKLFEE